MRKAGTGKGILTATPEGGALPVSLAFFLIFLALSMTAPDCPAQQKEGMNYPVINRLGSRTDVGFKQFESDVLANRARLVGMRADLQAAVENLTIFQYTVRQGDHLLDIAKICLIPREAIASLNRINHQDALTAGTTLLLPSCYGIFIPSNPASDMELIIAAGRLNDANAVELRISRDGIPQIYRFIPGAFFTQTERGVFSLPEGFRFPLRNYRLTSSYGLRPDPFTGRQQMHSGIDLAAPEGTAVYAVADGIVEDIRYNHPVFGNYIIIKHRNNWTSFYAHLQKVETALRSEVKSTNLIGRVGSTGQSTGPHLHFELRQDGKHIDPDGRLRG